MTLPKGWVAARIGDLCDLINGMAFKPTDWARTGLPIIRIQNLNKPNAEFNYCNTKVDPRFLVGTGELLFAWSGTPGTSFGAHIWTGPQAVLNQHIFRVRFDEEQIDKAYFRRAINAKLEELIGNAHGGVGLAHVTKGKFEATEVALPPLAEQRRIVAKLDTLTARLARARADLDRVPVLAKSMRATAMQLAFAPLGTSCRDDQQLDPAIDGRTLPIHTLPGGWEWKAVSRVCKVSGGLTKNSARGSTPSQVPYLRVANVYTNELRLDDVSSIGCTTAELEKTRLETGDILVVEGNGSLGQVGRAAIWRDEIPNCSHQNHIIRLRPDDITVPEFILFWFMSPEGRARIERLAASTSGLHTLSISKIAGMPIPMPSREQMGEIVAQLKSAFARADRLEAEATRARALLDRLEAAVLAKAFRGELVPQDPTDEPAATLLARIRAVRADTPKAKRGRRAKTEAS